MRGVRPTEGRELLHRVPLLWDYAHVAGYDTAYWTSQNLMFGNARLYVHDIPVSHRCIATELDTQAPLDEGCEDRLATELGAGGLRHAPDGVLRRPQGGARRRLLAAKPIRSPGRAGGGCDGARPAR